MKAERILVFKRVAGGRDEAGREPVSPFHCLAPPRALTPRQLQHRQRMLEALRPAGGRLPPLQAQR